MPITITGLQEWERSIRRVVDSQWVIEQSMSFTLTDTGAPEALARLPERLRTILSAFMQEGYLSPDQGVLYREFHKRDDPDYWPMYENGGDPTRMSRKSKVNMGQGFTALWRKIAENPVASQSETTITAGIGHRKEIEAMPLNRYMGTSGSMRTTSRFNSLFLASEFGTGIADNVGAGNVRFSGPTKDKHTPGAWWLARRTIEYQASSALNKNAFSLSKDQLELYRQAKQDIGETSGVKFLGQKAMHFLYDERREQPKQEYADFFRRRFPKFVREKLGAGMKVM